MFLDLETGKHGSLIDECINAMAGRFGSDDEDSIPDIALWRPNPIQPGRSGIILPEKPELGELSPQEAVIHSTADIIFFGGSAGGGKTDLGCGLATCYHKVTHIFRRVYTQTTGIRRRFEEIIGKQGRYNDTYHVWRVFPGKRIIEIAGIENEKDKQNWQGRAGDLKVFDEITQFSKSIFEYVILWCRSEIPGQRTRVVATGNPPTEEDGMWVIEYWAAWLDPAHPNPARPGELRWYAQIGEADDAKYIEVPDGTPFENPDRPDEMIYPKSRTFIPALVGDNPYYGNDYIATLQAAPEPLRSQMLYGNFNISVKPNVWQVIPTAWALLAIERGKKQPFPTSPQTGVGVDTSYGGRDLTVIAPRYDNWFGELLIYQGEEVDDGDKQAQFVMLELAAEGIAHVDGIGWGATVCESLNRIGANYSTVNFGNKAEYYDMSEGKWIPYTDRSGKFKFANWRALCYWRLREALDPEHGIGICLPNDRKLLTELTAPRYEVRTRGIQIEEKKDIIKRIGVSPNRADAVALIIGPTPSSGEIPQVDISSGSAKGWTGREPPISASKFIIKTLPPNKRKY